MEGDLETGKVIFYMDTLKQIMDSKIIYFPKKECFGAVVNIFEKSFSSSLAV